MVVEGGLGVGERIRPHSHFERLVGVQRLHEVAAELRSILIDDGDRYAAKNLAEIGLRIERSIDERRKHDQAQHPTVGENSLDLVAHRNRHASPVPQADHGRLLAFRGRLGDGAQSHPCEREIKAGKASQDHERPDRVGSWHTSRRLFEQDLQIPAKRQDGAPGLRESSHRHNRESHASESERRVAEYCDETQSNREGLNQQNEQSSKGKIAYEHEAGRRGDEQRVASEGYPVEDVDDGGVHHHHDQEDGEERQELAQKRDQRPAAGDAHPGALAALREFRADGVAAGDPHHDLQHRRQNRPQQELGEVQRRVRQDILFRDEDAGLITAVRFVRQRGGRRRDGAGDRRGRVVAGRIILPVVQRHHLRPLPGKEIALEVLGDVDGRNRIAGADGLHSAPHVARSLGDGDARRGGDRLHIDERGGGAVGVDDGDAKIANDRIAECQGEYGEGEDGNEDGQNERDAIAPHPAQLASCDQKQSRLWRRSHLCSAVGHSA